MSSVGVNSKTRSLCPECLREIAAQIVERDDKIYLEKKCEKHGIFEVVLEKDVSLYKKLMHYSRTEQNEFTSLFLPLSEDCDLECSICCFPNGAGSHTTKELKKAISAFKGKIRLSGGEPTLRKDIIDILLYLKEKNKPYVLITNGLRLAEDAFLKELIAAGLQQVAISINGFKKSYYQQIHGADLLARKMKALANLKKYRVSTVLSTMLVKDINDQRENIREIYSYCIKNNDFIKEWRLRPAVLSGRHCDVDRLYMSDLIRKVSQAMHIDKDSITRHYMNSVRRKASCHISIDCINLLYEKISALKIHNSWVKKIYGAILFWKVLGFWNTLRIILGKIHRQNSAFNLFVELRVWPDKYTIDLQQIKQCFTAHLGRDLKKYPCCYYTIIDKLLDVNIAQGQEN